MSQPPTTLDTSGSKRRATPEENSGSVSPALTPLNMVHDNFEALLLLLLRAYTKQNHASTSSSLISAVVGEVGISGDALDTLSSEQISALVTSNSVNYEVVQHILAKQKMCPGGRGLLTPSNLNEASLSQSSPSDVLADMSSASASAIVDPPQRRASVGPSSPRSPTATPTTRTTNALLANVADTNQQLQQKVQITPEQLNLLQTQVQGLLQSQNIPLPSDLSVELIQTLLLRQLQQIGSVANVSLKEETPVTVASSASGRLSAVTVSGGTLEGGTEATLPAERGGGSPTSAPAKVRCVSKNGFVLFE